MKKILTVLIAGGLLLSCNTQKSVQTTMKDNEQAAKELKAFPEAEAGKLRHVIYLDPKEDETAYKVEIIPGKMMKVDCNLHNLAGTLEEKDLKGWGYTYFDFTSEGKVISTRMMCPDKTLTTKFISGKTQLVRYNSKLPIVVYTPQGVDVKYKIWEAGKENNAVEK